LELKAATDQRPESRFANGEANSPVINEGTPLAIYEATIRQAAGWQKRYPMEAQDTLRDVVGGYNLDQILGVPGGKQYPESKEQEPVTKKQLANEVKEKIGSKPSRGLVFSWIVINEIKIADEAPPDVRKAMEERWASPIQRQVKIAAAETKRDEMAVETEARANFITQIEDARMKQSLEWLKIIDQLKDKLPAIESTRVAAGYVSVIRELLGRVGRDERDDLMYLGRLQRVLFGDGTHRNEPALPVPALLIDQAQEAEDEDEEDEDTV
jgi:regulator of protease activity HflC (stomatin/prohibitin superfamily)